MTDETEQKILNAALKVFAEKGYKGATTMAISKKAGFSEKTLFRKFKTKENLFNSVIIQNNEKIMRDIDSILKDQEFENPKDFLKVLIRNLIDFAEDNYEHLNITINDGSKISETVMEKFIIYLSEYMEKNIKNDKIDYPIFVMSITSFTYLLVHNKRQGHTFFDHEDVIEKYTNNLMLCI